MCSPTKADYSYTGPYYTLFLIIFYEIKIITDWTQFLGIFRIRVFRIFVGLLGHNNLYEEILLIIILETLWTTLCHLLDKYYPVFRLWSFMYPTVVVCHPDDLKVGLLKMSDTFIIYLYSTKSNEYTDGHLRLFLRLRQILIKVLPYTTISHFLRVMD